MKKKAGIDLVVKINPNWCVGCKYKGTSSDPHSSDWCESKTIQPECEFMKHIKIEEK